MDEVKTETQNNTPLTLLDEVRAERQLLEKVRDEARAEANRLEKLRANELLSSTAGIRVDTKPKEETAKEYRRRIEKELREKAKQNVGV